MEEPVFLCDNKDCQLLFPTLNQLNLHKKKHEMVLSLNRANFTTTDQTPTPTRFIRNCEEIGLFQDLQNVNPFEETFKKAAESAKRGHLKVSNFSSFLSKPAGDDLHTPHVFPEINESHPIEAELEKDLSTEVEVEEVVVRSEADTSLLDPVISGESSQLSEIQSISQPEEPFQVLFRMPNGSFIQLSTKPVKTPPKNIGETINISQDITTINNGGTLILTTQQHMPNPNQKELIPQSPLVKEKLKAFLGNGTKPRLPTIVPETRSNQLRRTKPTRRSEPGNMKKMSDEPLNDSEKERKRKILERNREAAYRCREKRKKWVEDLARKSDHMTAANRLLIQEVSSLKAEVLRLKSILLAHASCSVTLAAMSGGVVEDQISNVTTANILTVPMNNQKSGFRKTREVRPREGLTLDIGKASENTLMDLDSPSLVRRDEVLASVAPPSTPDDRLVTFSEFERDGDNSENEDRQMNTHTVIQLNPNALRTHFS